MIALLMALALGVSQTTDDPIDAAFAHLDERYFAMLMSNSSALSAAVGAGPSDESASTTNCLSLLTPLHEALSTKILRREMRLFSTIVPEARDEAFEVARATRQRPRFRSAAKVDDTGVPRGGLPVTRGLSNRKAAHDGLTA